MDPKFSAPDLTPQQIKKTRRNGGWPKNRDIDWNAESPPEAPKSE